MRKALGVTLCVNCFSWKAKNIMVDQEEFLRKIVQYLNDQQNEALTAELQLFINESTDNKRIYDQIVFLWNNSSELQKLDQLDENVAVLNLEAKLAELQYGEVEQPEKNKFNLSRWVAVAAVLLIGIIGYMKFSQQAKVNYLVKATQGTVDSVVLADGSKIYLDAYSELKYPSAFNNDTREINLSKGQAFFKIHRDTLHPFVVDIRHSSVTVLGTSFNIDSHGSQIALNVSTGKVKFQPLADKMDGSILHAGTGIVYDETNEQELILNAVNHNNQYWLTHEIDFNDASLIEVCKQLEDCYKVKITLLSNTSAFKKFNAHFKDNKLSDVIEVLRDTYPIKVKQDGGGSITIKSVAK